MLNVKYMSTELQPKVALWDPITLIIIVNIRPINIPKYAYT